MAIELDIEMKVIQRFVIKSKRDRYLAFIQNDKNRIKFINELHHMNFLEMDLFEKVEGNEREFIRDRLLNYENIKDCYVISETARIDKIRLDIDTALMETIGSDQGTLLVFGDAEILYAEAEGFNRRWISKKINSSRNAIK